MKQDGFNVGSWRSKTLPALHRCSHCPTPEDNQSYCWGWQCLRTIPQIPFLPTGMPDPETTSGIQVLEYLEGCLSVSKDWALYLSGDLAQGVHDVGPRRIRDPHQPSHLLPVRSFELVLRCFLLALSSMDKQAGVACLFSTPDHPRSSRHMIYYG